MNQQLGPTILYIEDDQSSANLMKRLLTNQGYRFMHASNGIEGINIASSEHPDLILVDIHLPDLDGLAITTRLRNIAGLQNRPIVAMTAHSHLKGRELALASGCNGYITKPIDIDRLSEQLQRYLQGYEEKLPASEEHKYLKAHTADVAQTLEDRVRELAEANERLKFIDTQRAHFFNAVSHELRTPFTPIRGYIELLQDKSLGPLTDKQERALSVVSENLTNALRILDDLLDLSKLKASNMHLEPAYFSARRLLNEVVMKAQTFMERSSVTFKTDIAPKLPSIYGDEDRLRQVIINLLHNAYKFTDAGTITLTARIRKDMLIIQVKDTGSGLLPEEIPHVFNEFWQSKDIHGTGIGTGVGLSISKYLIEAHQGKIWLESKKGEGTTVTVTLPLVKEEAVK